MIVARCSFQTSHPPWQARRGECGSANGLQLASSHSARGAVRRRYLPGIVPGEKGFGNYTATLATFCRPWACPRGKGFGNYTAALACSVPRLPPSPPPAAAEKAGKTKGVLAADGLGLQTRCPLGQAQWGAGGRWGARTWATAQRGAGTTSPLPVGWNPCVGGRPRRTTSVEGTAI